MFAAVRAFFRRLAARRHPPKLRIDFDDEGLLLLSDEQPCWRFRWCDVRSISAYKQDLFTIDCICAEFEVAEPASGGEARFYTVHEDMERFDWLCFGLRRHFPGLPEDWWQKITLPPFAANHTLLWPTQAPPTEPSETVVA